MVAVSSYGYILTRRDEDFILATVFEAFSHSSMLDIYKPGLETPDLRKLFKSSVFVQSLWIRVAYGGMDGDAKMLAGLSRVMSEPPVPSKETPPLCCPGAKAFNTDMAKAYLPLKPSDILEVSKDFHVFPQIVDRIAGTLCEDPAKVKLAIWAHGSGVTVRRSADGKPLAREGRAAETQEATRGLWQTILGKGLFRV
jgi:hypothetical protein